MAIKPQIKEEPLAVLPEEEVKIKEIEEIVEETAPVEEGAKPIKKGRARQKPEERTKPRRKE